MRIRNLDSRADKSKSEFSISNVKFLDCQIEIPNFRLVLFYFWLEFSASFSEQNSLPYISDLGGLSISTLTE